MEEFIRLLQELDCDASHGRERTGFEFATAEKIGDNKISDVETAIVVVNQAKATTAKSVQQAHEQCRELRKLCKCNEIEKAIEDVITSKTFEHI